MSELSDFSRRRGTETKTLGDVKRLWNVNERLLDVCQLYFLFKLFIYRNTKVENNTLPPPCLLFSHPLCSRWASMPPRQANQTSVDLSLLSVCLPLL